MIFAFTAGDDIKAVEKANATMRIPINRLKLLAIKSIQPDVPHALNEVGRNEIINSTHILLESTKGIMRDDLKYYSYEITIQKGQMNLLFMHLKLLPSQTSLSRGREPDLMAAETMTRFRQTTWYLIVYLDISKPRNSVRDPPGHALLKLVWFRDATKSRCSPIGDPLTLYIPDPPCPNNYDWPICGYASKDLLDELKRGLTVSASHTPIFSQSPLLDTALSLK
ncbi:hypothetical protein CHS0354_027517 [Potamilus streckersoni]|uniref:Uncharacterized protein n=1 Tax=Potamilus streckersoni TaxID=2493646 RepID=A0AAE0S4L2_9BIVA|nr:hypothetical protein CHS0354_027517 [Potamilus streckersoni]